MLKVGKPPLPFNICFFLTAGIKEVRLPGSLLLTVTVAVTAGRKPAWGEEHQPKLQRLF